MIFVIVYIYDMTCFLYYIFNSTIKVQFYLNISLIWDDFKWIAVINEIEIFNLLQLTLAG